MSIVQLVEIQGAVLAVDDAGTLVLWDLREVRKVQGVYIFKDNISLLPSKSSLKIDPHSLQGLKQFQNTLVMYNQETIYLTTVQHVFQSFREERAKNVTVIHSATFLEKKELIKCLVLLSEQTLLIGTSKGNIYRYDFTQSAVLQRISLGNETKQEPSQLTVFATTPKQVHEVNSIAVYGEFVLAALSNGKAYSLQSQTLEQIFELTASLKASLQPIERIVFSKDQEKIYLLHENYITEWSLKLSACLCYIEYPHPKDVLVNDRITIIGNHSKLVWYDSAVKDCSLSMRSAQTIREIGSELVAIGGSDGTIDVMMGGMRLMTLFHRA